VYPLVLDMAPYMEDRADLAAAATAKAQTAVLASTPSAAPAPGTSTASINSSDEKSADSKQVDAVPSQVV